MDHQRLSCHFCRALGHELFRSRYGYGALAGLLLAGALAGAFLWPSTYLSRAQLGVDSVGTLVGEAKLAFENKWLQTLRERLRSPAFAEQVRQRAQSTDTAPAAASGEALLAQLEVALGDPHAGLRLSLAAASPDRAQWLLQQVVAELGDSLQANDSLQKLRDDNAALDAEIQQVQSRMDSSQRNLSAARLTLAVIESRSGAERIAEIHKAIQEAQVGFDASTARIAEIQRQLVAEERYQSEVQQLQLLRAQRQKLQTSLEQLRDTYLPGDREMLDRERELDAVNIEIQRLTDNNVVAMESRADSSELYEQLRRDLTHEQVEKNSLQSRLESLRKILRAESQEADSSHAQRSEVEQIERALHALKAQAERLRGQREHNDALARELAQSVPRLLVEQAPSLAASYRGLGAREFLLLGPIAALLLPLAIALLIVATDTRIRSLNELRAVLPPSVLLMGAIPHNLSPQTARLYRRARWGLVLWLILAAGAYCAVWILGFNHWG